MKTLLFNGEIITVNDEDEIVEAVLFEDGKILYAGKKEEALKLCDEDDEKIDLEGKTVLPGFIESHIHFMSKLCIARGIDLSKASGITDIDSLKARLVQNIDGEKWLICHGLTFENLDEKRWPTRWELDEVTANVPVAITHSSGHTGLYNTKALEILGVSEGRMDLPQEFVERDPEGRLTGVLNESAHMMCSDRVRELNPVTEEDMKNFMREIEKQMNSCGITSAHDAGGTGTTTINAEQKLYSEEGLTLRCYPMLFSILGKDHNVSYVKSCINSGIFTGLGDDFFRIGPLKIMIDGSGASGTCATRKPMSHNGKINPTSMSQEEVDDIVIAAHKKGYQVTAHCIGDKAVEMILDAYEKAQKEYPRDDCRHRIEHCMIAEPDLLERIRRQKVIPVYNPTFINLWGASFNKYYNGERADYLIPLKSSLDMGICCTIASDYECCPNMEPVKGIASAMDRMIYETGETLAVGQAISLMQAIRCYTMNAAYAEFAEDKKGSIEKGKFADLVVLDGTITALSPREIYDMKVMRTYCDGKLVYKRG
ncbi:MAG: amidohydrolase [Lachnospiraceae bacterium]|nr:amidohydrolase [Lachnospiraceae bacterium]